MHIHNIWCTTLGKLNPNQILIIALPHWHPWLAYHSPGLHEGCCPVWSCLKMINDQCCFWCWCCLCCTAAKIEGHPPHRSLYFFFTCNPVRCPDNFQKLHWENILPLTHTVHDNHAHSRNPPAMCLLTRPTRETWQSTLTQVVHQQTKRKRRLLVL